jgi:tRNA threonylcarbamoyladenosine biosynthesis protein TsaE
MKITLRTSSEKETIDAGVRMASCLQSGDLVCLEGELGSGKTCLVRGVAIGLGLDPRSISSPTFTIAHVHGHPGGSLYHLDAYRLGGLDDLETIGWDEMRSDSQGIVICEWGSRISGALPRDRIEVSLQHEGLLDRWIELVAPDAWSARFKDVWE